MVHVAVLGAAGGIGQPLSLLMKQDVRVTKLTLYDIVNTPGVAADLSHIDTPAVVTGYLPPDDGLKKTLVGADVVIIPAGMPRKPGMTRDDLFKINAGIVRDLAKAIAIHAPDSYILVISNPVNSTVPIVAEEMKKEDVYEPRRLFGVTTLDVLRGSTFTAEAIGEVSRAPRISVPVLGGHSGATILPVVSQCIPSFNNDLSEQQVADLIKRIQYGGDEVVKAKDGAGSATLSMAYAGAKFASKLIYSWFTTDDQITQTYVDLDGDEQGGRHVRRELDKYNGEKLKTPMQFFSVTCKLGIDGVKQILPIGDLSPYEVGILKTAIPELQESIAKGAEFITKAPKL